MPSQAWHNKARLPRSAYSCRALGTGASTGTSAMRCMPAPCNAWCRQHEKRSCSAEQLLFRFFLPILALVLALEAKISGGHTCE